jgi:S1 RNA binding domain protein
MGGRRARGRPAAAADPVPLTARLSVHPCTRYTPLIERLAERVQVPVAVTHATHALFLDTPEGLGYNRSAFWHPGGGRRPGMSLEAGSILEGVVVKITHYGAFVELGDGKSGLVHISEIADTYVKDVRDYLKEQERVKVKVLGYNDKGKLDLSVKQALDPAERQARVRAKASFEEKLTKFMKESEERLLDLKRNTEAKRGGRRR